MFRLQVCLGVLLFYSTSAVSWNLDDDFNDIFCWEAERGHRKETSHAPVIGSQSSCSTNISQFGNYFRKYYMLRMPGLGYMTVQSNRNVTTDITRTDDYSYLTLVRNTQYSNANEATDRDAFYFAPTQDSEWCTLHNRYTDLHNGYATVLEGVFDNGTYTMLIMKHHLNTSTEKEWINPRYLWKLVVADEKTKEFRLVSKAFPGDFVTWTYLEYTKGEHYWQLERSKDLDYRKKYEVGGEWWRDTWFSLELMWTGKCTNDFNSEKDNIDQDASTAIGLTPFSFMFTGLLLTMMHAI